jgi:Ca-activated chloride channel family protein
MTRHQSIRDQLESDAWRHHYDFAQRCARRSARPGPNRGLRWEDRALLILAALLMLLLIVRVETARADTIPTEPDFWGVEFHGGDVTIRSVALDTEVRAEVNGLVARIDVSQRFQNTGVDWAEAEYRFPLPEGAAVDRLLVRAGQRILQGEIREKEDARRQYLKARNEGRVASLVEQQRVNQFSTRLVNIAAGEEIRVSISFLTRVAFQDGEYSLRIPLTFTPRWDPPGTGGEPLRFTRAEDAGGYGLTLDVRLNTGLALAVLESRYHDIDVHPALNGYHVVLADPGSRSDRVFELAWIPEFGQEPAPSLTTWNGPDATYALLMLAPPLADGIAPQPREVVFVIDTSGSMAGTSINQARRALLQGMAWLEDDDRFNLVEFNSDARQLFDESVPAYSSYLQEAAAFVEDLDANGGTNMRPALELAMSLPAQDGLLRQIVFVTDGSVGNESELLTQIGQQLGASRLFTVSIGSAPNDWFMRKAAVIGRGSHTAIGRVEEVERRMAALWARIETPALQDVYVDWGMQAEYYPEIIPDLYAGEPLWLYARLPREPGAVTLCGELDGRYWETSTRLMPGGGSEDIAALWARNRIEALEDSRLFGADPEQVRADVLELALGFNLLTPYTSLVAVDRTPVRPGSEALASQAIPSLAPAGSVLSAGFSQTATGWPLQLALSLFSLLLATAMLLYRPPSRVRARGGIRRSVAHSNG